MDKLIETCDFHIKWINTYLDKKDASKAQSQFGTLEKEFAKLLVPATQDNPKVVQLQERVTQVKSKLDSEVVVILLQQQASKVIQEAENHVKWINSYLDKKETAKATAQLKKLDDTAKALLDPKFASLAEVIACIAKCDDTRTRAGLTPYSAAAPVSAAYVSVSSSIPTVESTASPTPSPSTAAAAAPTPSPAPAPSPSPSTSAPVDPATLKQAKALIEKVEFHLKWVNTYLYEKNDGNKAQSQWKTLEEEAKKLFSEKKFEEIAEVKEAKAKFDAMERNLASGIKAAERENEIEKIIAEVKTSQNNMKSAISRNDTKSAADWKKKVDEKSIILRTQFADSQKVSSFLLELDEFIALLGSSFAKILFEKEISDGIAEMTPMVKALEGALSRKDIISAQRWTKELNAKFTFFASKFAAEALATAFIRAANELLLKVESEIGPLILEKEIKDEIKKLTPSVSALKGALSRKDPNSASVWRNYLQPKFSDFEENYNSHYAARKFIDDTADLFSKVDSTLGELIAAKEVKSIIDALTPVVKAIEGALDRKDASVLTKYQQQLASRLPRLADQYADHSVARPFINSVNDLLVRSQSELGALTQQESLKSSLATVSPLLKYLNSALERGDTTSALNYKVALENKLPLFAASFASCPLGQQFVSDAQKALEVSEQKLGAALVAQELARAEATIGAAIKYMNSALERGNTAQAGAHKRKAEALFVPFSEKYIVRTDLAEIQAFINTVQVALFTADSNMENTTVEQEIQQGISDLTTVINHLKSVIDRNESKFIAQYKIQLTDTLTPFAARFASHQLASGTVLQARQLLERVEKDFSSVLGENEVEAHITALSPLVQELRAAIDNKEVSKVGPLYKKLNNKYYRFCLKNASKPEAKSFIKDTEGLLQIASIFAAKNKSEDQEPEPEPEEPEPEVPGVESLKLLAQNERAFVERYLYEKKKIEDRWNEYLENKDDIHADSRLRSIADITEGIFKWADHHQVIRTGALKVLFEQIGSMINTLKDNLLVEFWQNSVSGFWQQWHNSVASWEKGKDKAEKVEKAEVWLRNEKWKFIPYSRMFISEDARKYWNRIDKMMQEKNAALISPITLWPGRDAEIIREFTAKLEEVGNQQISVSWIPTLEKLLEEYSAKIKEVNGTFGHVLIWGVEDFLLYLKEFNSTLRRPGAGSRTSMGLWQKDGENVLRHMINKDYEFAFSCLEDAKAKIDANITGQIEHPAVEKERNLVLYAEFKEEMLEIARKRSFPLVEKYEMKGKIVKSKSVLGPVEKHLASDPQFITFKKRVEEIRKNRATALTKLAEIDARFNKILADAADALAKSDLDKQRDGATDFTKLHANSEVIPKIESFKGKVVHVHEDHGGSPTNNQVLELSNGNWRVRWDKELEGGKDYEDLQEISNSILNAVLKVHNVSNDISKKTYGLDELATFIQTRARIARGPGAWYTTGEISGFEDYITHHFTSTTSEASIRMIVPRDAIDVNIEQRIVSHTISYKWIGRMSIEHSEPNYEWSISYRLKKQCVVSHATALRCDYYSAIKNGPELKVSVTSVLPQLRALVPQ